MWCNFKKMVMKSGNFVKCISLLGMIFSAPQNSASHVGGLHVVTGVSSSMLTVSSEANSNIHFDLCQLFFNV